MSWSFNVTGLADKEAAKAEVKKQAEIANGHFPESAQAIVNAAIDNLPDRENSTISLKSFGHFNDGTYPGSSNISVEIDNNQSANG